MYQRRDMSGFDPVCHRVPVAKKLECASCEFNCSCLKLRIFSVLLGDQILCLPFNYETIKKTKHKFYDTFSCQQYFFSFVILCD